MSGPARISEYFVAERPEVVDFLRPFGAFSSVLDIGCAAGELGKLLLHNRMAGSCDGIEPNPQAALLAQGKLRRVWSGTLEAVADDIPWPQYDLVVMADVLEHVVDPWATLRSLHAHTAPACKLLLSVPNIRHYKVVLPLLLKGEFKYCDQGIMDRTHLHFFTKSSLLEMIEECGWVARGMDSHMRNRYRRWYYPTRLVEPFVAVQYMLMAEKR